MRPRPDTPDLMQTLPPELRNRIYHLALPGQAHLKLPCKEPPLLRTSLQIRSETAPIYFGNSTVYINGRLDLPTFAVAIKPIADIVRECGTRPFKDLVIRMNGAVWPHLDELLPFLEIMRANEFEPATKEYKPSERETYTDYPGKEKTRLPVGTDSIFSLSNEEHGAVEQVLEKAVTLGRRARDEQWTKEELAKAFTGFVARKGKDPKPPRAKRSKP
ncbi:hypothetical protein LTR36_000494 [Oleoguttula mirabilis]|uniref:Uncharacterized protein n=1 Tax=Oleoguttula mirabilis TaxID=1507867 RepID=A0AAV9JQ73_9PEZI|nr:hypothetical protein LTR36_000494 [Oleoguttula mirabilis]